MGHHRLLASSVFLMVALVPAGTGLTPVAARPQALVAEHVQDLPGGGGQGADRSVHHVDTGISTELVGFESDGAVPDEIQLRSLTPSGWSDWATVAGEPSEGPDAGSKEYRATTSAGPVWVGHGVRQIQYRVTKGQPVHLRMHAIRSEGPAGASAPGQSATAGVAQPGIITRAQWGADERWRTFAPGCDGSVSQADNVHYLVVHHTVTSNSYAPSDSASMVRGIYFFHTHSNLWCDIGYNFLIDQYGQIFEGRFGGVTKAVIGAHAGGFNTGSAGIALLGTFDSTYPSAAMYSALRRLAGWKASFHAINSLGTVTVVAGNFPAAHWPPGTNVTLPTIIGHREVDGTDCPGSLAYSVLAQLRQDVGADVGTGWYRPWSAWSAESPPAPPGIKGAPAVASWGVTHFDQFVQGKDNHLWHRSSDDSAASFSAWEDLGAPPGGLTSTPAAVSWGSGRIDVFARGHDNALWHAWSDGGPWFGWESLGGVLTSAAAVSSWGIGRLDVFVAGTDHAIYHKWYDGNGWFGFESRGGYGVFDPAATSWGPGRVDLFTVGSTGALYHQLWNGAAWSGWANEVGGMWASGPGAASWGPGRLDVFLASNAAGMPMTHTWYTGTWYSESLGGSLTSTPAAVSWRYNRLDTFVRGTDSGIWHNTYPGL